jgi:aerobic carbon-monoxide dehydrogenase small subunit
MMPIGITVNGRALTATVEPRTHLADFLRDHLNLTGTHLGCEHGVCGACTLLLDDMPARSCITLAAACDGAHVTTIEGLDEDEIAAELRAAFTREHALQCGYCTPGMLISARDLVLRLDAPDERAIRVGLSGNLCRCTGYVGIVRAVRAVIEARRGRGVLPVAGAGRTARGPVGSDRGASTLGQPASSTDAEHPGQLKHSSSTEIPDFVPDKIFDDRLTVAYPADKVFDMLGEIRQVAACLPGASLIGDPTPEHVEGTIRVKLGPISAGFRGAARIERDPKTMSGRIVGTGADQRTRSSTQGEIRYRLVPIDLGAATRVELSIGYSLHGMLAQVAREGLMRDLISRLVAEFARNLERSLSGTQDNLSTEPVESFDAIALTFDILRARVWGIIRKTWRR